jgi:Ca-activated chloride channel family protein
VVGVVAFRFSGISTQAPTRHQDPVRAALDRLVPQKGTSVGQGILASLKAISLAETGPNVDFYTRGTPAPTPTPAPVPAGSHDSAVIVLISDGENNESPSPAQAAGEAAQRGVRIFTVGMGSEEGTFLDL